MKIALSFLGGLILLMAVGASPVFAQQLERGSEGSLGCIGNHRKRLNGTELSFTSYTFRNFNQDKTLIIDEITIYDGLGTPLSTLSAGDIILNNNGPVLGPNQTTSFTTKQVFGTSNVQPRPLQVIVDWSSYDGKKALELWGNTARQDERLDGVDSQEIRARGNIRCGTLRLK